MQELSAAFIPTADQIEGTGRRGCLEDGTDLESRLVQKIKKQCNNLASHQGVFVATPSGLFLTGGHQTMHDPRQIESAMRQGLEKWQKLASAERLMSREDFDKAQAELAAADRASQYPLTAWCWRGLPRLARRSGRRLTTRRAMKSGSTRITPGSARARRTFVPPTKRPGAKCRAIWWNGGPPPHRYPWGTTSPPAEGVERRADRGGDRGERPPHVAVLPGPNAGSARKAK